MGVDSAALNRFVSGSLAQSSANSNGGARHFIGFATIDIHGIKSFTGSLQAMPVVIGWGWN